MWISPQSPLSLVSNFCPFVTLFLTLQVFLQILDFLPCPKIFLKLTICFRILKCIKDFFVSLKKPFPILLNKLVFSSV